MLGTKEYRDLMYGIYSCRIGQDWIRTPAIEYWLHPGLVSQGVGAFSSGVMGVSNNGWVNTGTILGVAGSAADFPAAAHNTFRVSQASGDLGTPNHFAIDTAGDLLNSPAMFGDPTHMAVVSELVGMKDLPNRLIFDSWSSFSVFNTESDTSGFGFVEDGGAASVANDQLACFVTDGTNFILRSGAATSSSLGTADAATHRFRVVIDRLQQLAIAYIDNMETALGSIAITADELPCSFGAGILAATGANFIRLGSTRIRYAWMGW